VPLARRELFECKRHASVPPRRVAESADWIQLVARGAPEAEAWHFAHRGTLPTRPCVTLAKRPLCPSATDECPRSAIRWLGAPPLQTSPRRDPHRPRARLGRRGV